MKCSSNQINAGKSQTGNAGRNGAPGKSRSREKPRVRADLRASLQEEGAQIHEGSSRAARPSFRAFSKMEGVNNRVINYNRCFQSGASGPAAGIAWELIRRTHFSGSAPDSLSQRLWVPSPEPVLTSPLGDSGGGPSVGAAE